jgi:hypothetical protein
MRQMYQMPGVPPNMMRGPGGYYPATPMQYPPYGGGYEQQDDGSFRNGRGGRGRGGRGGGRGRGGGSAGGRMNNTNGRGGRFPLQHQYSSGSGGRLTPQTPSVEDEQQQQQPPPSQQPPTAEANDAMETAES